MRTIICNISNLDATIAVWGLQSIVRTVASVASVVRGVSRSVHVSRTHLMRLLVVGKAKPAFVAIPIATVPAAAQQQGCWQPRTATAGYLCGFQACSDRVGRS